MDMHIFVVGGSCGGGGGKLVKSYRWEIWFQAARVPKTRNQKEGHFREHKT